MEEIVNIGGQVSEVDWVDCEVAVPIHIVDICPLCVKRDPVLSVVVYHRSVIILSAVAVLALMPSQSPLRLQNWLTNDGLVESDDRVRSLCSEHHIDVCHTTSCDLLELDYAFTRLVLDDPVLGVSLLEEDSYPVVRVVLVHEEGVRTIGLFAWRSAILCLGRLVCGPHRVDTVLVEQVLLRSLTQT